MTARPCTLLSTAALAIVLTGCLDETRTIITTTTGGGNNTDPPIEAPVGSACLDGQYAEPLPATNVGIDDLVAAYQPAHAAAFVTAVLERRYPVGRQLVDEGRAGTMNCVADFLDDTSSSDKVFRQLGTVVHECGHYADNARSTLSRNTYVLSSTQLLQANDGDSRARFGQTFPRADIAGDGYQSLRPFCDASHTDPVQCDMWGPTYLTGASGSQGFNLLFEEFVQYSHSLATAMAFHDQQSVLMYSSDRDAMLTFIWYVERYLHRARLHDTAAYDFLVNGDSGHWRKAILTAWGRAWWLLESTESMGNLGYSEDRLLPLVSDPVLLEEIERLRTAEGCL